MTKPEPTPLPDAEHHSNGPFGLSVVPWYSADQMHAHAAARDAAWQVHADAAPKQDDADRQLLRALFEVCEATEEECADSQDSFKRGRAWEAKSIRRGVGTWYQDTFCGPTHMGEPVVQPRTYTQAEVDALVAQAVAQEREACAKLCDVTPPYPFRPSIEAAHAIRARTQGGGNHD